MKDIGPFYRQKNVQVITMALEFVILISLSQFCHKHFYVNEFFLQPTTTCESKQTANIGKN